VSLVTLADANEPLSS